MAQHAIVVPAVENTTHVHDLPTDCLVNILSLVGDAELPIKRPRYHDLMVCHPLQCALVCKRWQSCARAAVRSLLFPYDRSLYSQRGFVEQAALFPNLKWLRSASHILLQVAPATPTLERLEVYDMDVCCQKDFFSALCSWTHLKDVTFGTINAFSDLPLWLPDILRELTSVESLSLESESYGSEISNGLQPTSVEVNKVKLQGTGPPPLIQADDLSLGVDVGKYIFVWQPGFSFQCQNITELHLNVMWGFRATELTAMLGAMIGLESLSINASDTRSFAATDHFMVPDPSVVPDPFLRDWTSSFPSNLGALSGLTSLKLIGCVNLTVLPETMGDLQALRVLHLENCNVRFGLRNGLERMTGVTDLRLDRLKRLPADLGAMHMLGDSRLSSELVTGHDFTKLPKSLGALLQLTQLRVQYFPFLKALPESIGNLRTLREIHLEHLDKVRQFPDSLGLLQSLESLNIKSCRVVTSLPETLGQLVSLTSFCLTRCKNIRRLPDSMGNLSNLRELVIMNCWSFHDESCIISKMKGLRYLGLLGWRHQSLPGGLEDLPALMQLQCPHEVIQRTRNVSRALNNVLEAEGRGRLE